jgi:hypothetical protein
MTMNFREAKREVVQIGRTDRAEDVGEAAVFLASESAGFITVRFWTLKAGCGPIEMPSVRYDGELRRP